MRRPQLLLLCIALFALGGAARAQTAPTPAAAAEAQPLVLEFDRIEIQRVAQTLSERTRKPVVLDSTVKPSLPVTLSGSAKSVEEALDQIAKPLGLTWKKVYAPRTLGVVNGQRIAQLVETVRTVTSPGVVIEDPASKKVTLFLQDLPAAADLEEQIGKAWPFLQPVYLLSDPQSPPPAEKREPSKQGPGDRFAAMERERMELLAQMAPEERVKAMQQGMAMAMQVDPTLMQEMMRTGMQALMQMMQTMSPEQRQQIMAMSMKMMQSLPPESWQNLFQLFRATPGAPPPPR